MNAFGGFAAKNGGGLRENKAFACALCPQLTPLSTTHVTTSTKSRGRKQEPRTKREEKSRRAFAGAPANRLS